MGTGKGGMRKMFTLLIQWYCPESGMHILLSEVCKDYTHFSFNIVPYSRMRLTQNASMPCYAIQSIFLHQDSSCFPTLKASGKMCLM